MLRHKLVQIERTCVFQHPGKQSASELQKVLEALYRPGPPNTYSWLCDTSGGEQNMFASPTCAINKNKMFFRIQLIDWDPDAALICSCLYVAVSAARCSFPPQHFDHCVDVLTCFFYYVHLSRISLQANQIQTDHFLSEIAATGLLACHGLTSRKLQMSIASPCEGLAFLPLQKCILRVFLMI